MAMYRCAACGSSRVVTEQRQEQYYNTRKGLMGTMLMGSAGGLMGISTNTVTYYHCLTCGQILSQPMNNHEKEMIDWYLSDSYKSSSFLKNYKEKYPNIEWDESEDFPTTETTADTLVDSTPKITEKFRFSEEEEERIRSAILDALAGDVQRTFSEINRTEALQCYSNILLSPVLHKMIKDGLVEREIDDDLKVAYFMLTGAKKRIAEQRKAEAKAHNKKINEQIEVLQEERKKQYVIVEKNKYKFWGTGAQAKKDALSQIDKLDAEIKQLINDIKPEE